MNNGSTKMTTVSTNAYGYDPAGNRLSETTLGGTIGGVFNHPAKLPAELAAVETSS